MYHIRKTKTASGATAVQVVSYLERKMTLSKHIGSGRTNEEIDALLKIAGAWVKKQPSNRACLIKLRNNTALPFWINVNTSDFVTILSMKF
jgi:hypothetical protein